MSRRDRARAFGALVALAGVAPLIASCEEKRASPPPPGAGRSNAVVVDATSTPTSTARSAATGTAAPAASIAAPRALCTEPTSRPHPRGPIKTAAVSGGSPPAASIPFGAGKWIWVNFFAAWCGPCKEEMPRLLAWKERLARAGILLDLAFVSIDDDERELQRFLEAQPLDGVRASYWLPEGAGRAKWLGALGLRETPELPAHALVAPSGEVRCVFQGAVEERDYPSLSRFVGGRP